jgi:hypothetical protein
MRPSYLLATPLLLSVSAVRRQPSKIANVEDHSSAAFPEMSKPHK